MYINLLGDAIGSILESPWNYVKRLFPKRAALYLLPSMSLFSASILHTALTFRRTRGEAIVELTNIQNILTMCFFRLEL